MIAQHRYAHAAGLLTVGLGAALAAALGGSAIQTLATAVLLGLLVPLAWSDAISHTVPDGLTLPFIVAGLIYASASGGPILNASILAGALVLVALVQDWLAPDRGWIGSGDYLLLAGATSWLGPRAVPDIIMITAFLLGLYAIVARQKQLAVAPFLSIAVAALWFGDLTP